MVIVGPRNYFITTGLLVCKLTLHEVVGITLFTPTLGTGSDTELEEKHFLEWQSKSGVSRAQARDGPHEGRDRGVSACPPPVSSFAPALPAPQLPPLEGAKERKHAES